jgi:D-aminopeptidase
LAASTFRNLITDVPGIAVGNAHDETLRSGVTVVLPDERATAVIDVRGGGTGTRDTRVLDYEGAVDEIHALVLSGGSAFGLDAATGVQAFLRERGVGFAVADARVPIVPQAILFDLLNGGDKDWGKRPPYQDLGYAACENAGQDFALGTAGAGYGATIANLKGGLGSASAMTGDGRTVGALAAVNAVGTVTVGDTAHFWAAPYEKNGEFGGVGPIARVPENALRPALKSGPRGQATTLVIAATDAAMDQRGLKRVAVMAHAGMARAVYPAHTPLDGDILFALSTARAPGPDDPQSLIDLGMTAANVTARAIARAVYEATSFEARPRGLPAYRDKFAGASK